MQQGYYDEALRKTKDGYRRSQKDTSWNWRFRILEAEVLMRNRQVDSVDLLTEDPPSTLPPEIIGHKKIVQGQVLCRFNRQSDGQRVLDEAAAILGSKPGPLQGELLFARGICTPADGEIARQYFEKAADMLRASNPFLAASALGNVGYLYASEKHYDASIDWFQKVLPLAKSTNSQLLLERTLGNLGDSYSNLGDFQRAIEESGQAQRIAAEIGNLHDEESWLITLGRSYDGMLYDYRGNAEPNYLKALAIASKLQDDDIIQRCRHNLVQSALQEHDLKKAENYWKQEITGLTSGSARDINITFDEAQIAEAKKDLSKAKVLFSAILRDPKTIARNRGLAQEHLAKIYWSEGDTKDAYKALHEGMHDIEAELTGLKFPYRVSFMDESSSLFDTAIRLLMSEHKSDKALQIAEYKRTLVQNEQPSKEDALNISLLQHKLKRNQVILDYAVTDEESYLWVLTLKQFRVFQLPSHRELNSLINAYNTSIQEQHGMGDSYGGQELYKAVIQPAEKLIPKGATVTIIPSKVLCLLNFETLIVPGNKPHYWMEDFAIENADSLLSPKATRPRRYSKDMLLIGAPKEVNTSFPTLKHASDEIAQVQDHFPPDERRVITGENATPQAYEESAPQQYRFIHFVTHGIANEKAPMESAIVLSGSPDSYKLYAGDIIKVPLDADLVTVSACYGAGKRWYSSEGMVGLGWAFMQAGAHQVVAALWEVDDASTPQLMNDFYSELNKGKPAADALRNAKLELLHQGGVYNRPYYWASLQLYSHFSN